MFGVSDCGRRMGKYNDKRKEWGSEKDRGL